MSVILLSILFLLLLFCLPISTGLFARSMGRSFIRWFFIGIALPLVAVFIIFFLPDLSEGNSDRGEK